jgi:hypothetical protein
MRWKTRLEQGVQNAEPWVVVAALACTGWSLLATPLTCDTEERKAAFVARGECGTGTVELRHIGCGTHTLTAPEHLRLPTMFVSVPVEPNRGWTMSGPVVMARNDAGAVEVEAQMDCVVKRRNEARDGGNFPVVDGGDPDQLLCDCTYRGIPVVDQDGGWTGQFRDDGGVACDLTLDH